MFPFSYKKKNKNKKKKRLTVLPLFLVTYFNPSVLTVDTKEVVESKNSDK